MLPERHCELLAAYLDGELDRRRRRTALRLLRKSRRARAFFRKLQQDSDRLRALPAAVPAADLSPHVLRAIAERGLRPTAAGPGAAPAPAAAGVPGWLGLAVAASILLAIAVGSYLYFSRVQPGAPEQPPLAQHDRQPAPPVIVPKGNLPAPEEHGFRVAVRQLGTEAERGRLARELRKGTSYQLSLACRDSARGVERLRRAFQSQGIRLVLDKAAEERLRNKEHATSYLLYAENLLPDELTAVLRQLGVEATGTPAAMPFDTVVVSALTGERRRDLARLLGVSPNQLRPPARVAADAPMPLNETIIEAPAGQPAKGARPKQKGPAGPERLVLVLASDAAGPGHEAQEFMRRRRGPRAGTLQVVLVLREARL
jgi:hypothetical protein